jgi:penicillin-binding protein-related factor A (putative recombinase)
MSHANRGRALEQALEALHAHWMATAQAYVQRNHPPVRQIRARSTGGFVGVRTGSGPPDYTCCTGGRVLVFDAKHTEDTAVRFDKLATVDQAAQLSSALTAGVGAAVYIHSTRHAMSYLVPWSSLVWPWTQDATKSMHLVRASVPLRWLPHLAAASGPGLAFDYRAAIPLCYGRPPEAADLFERLYNADL